MKELAGLFILCASVLLPVGLARAALGLIVASLGSGAATQTTPNRPLR